MTNNETNNTQGSISKEGIDGILNHPHEDYRRMPWVPAWSLPPATTYFSAVTGSIGGAALGAGLSESNSEKQPLGAIKGQATACVAQDAACTHLRIETAGSGALIWIGALLLIIQNLHLFLTRRSRINKYIPSQQ